MFKKIMNFFKTDEKNADASKPSETPETVEKELQAGAEEAAETVVSASAEDVAAGPVAGGETEVKSGGETELSKTSVIVEAGTPDLSELEFSEKTVQKSWFERLRERLARTKNSFMRKLGEVFGDRMAVTEETLEKLEEILIEADIGVKTTQKIIAMMQERLDTVKIKNMEELQNLLKEIMTTFVNYENTALNVEGRPLSIVLVVGVNGVGKTTTIGKIAANLTRAGKKVMIVAGDTFRAGAIEQAEIWAKRAGIPIVKAQPNSDPAAVVFDAIKAARARGTQVLLVDTAGRLHTKYNLMEELKKIRKIISREIPDGPHEILQILDGTTGQNALFQARTFCEAMEGTTGLVMTKLDGTAKGGIVISISDELRIPIKLIGIGEGIDDLKEFNGSDFVRAIFE